MRQFGIVRPAARPSVVLLALAILVSACSGSPAASRAAGSGVASALPPSPSAFPVLADTLDAMVARFPVNGSVLVAIGDKVVLSNGYGLADSASGTPNTPETRFRIGSITKQFTAVAIVILESRGELDVDDAACDYLPSCPAAWSDVTIQQLLSHTAGLPDFTELPDYESTKAVATTPAATLAKISDLPLTFTPGTRFRYSNSGYLALGLIIEQVAGISYEAFLQREIFGPLGMLDSGFEHGADQLATGYTSAGAPADAIDMSVAYAAGGLSSTVLDMYRWDQALYTERLLPRDVMATIFQPKSVFTDIAGFAYADGFYIGALDGHPWVFHSGGIDGFQSFYGRHPDERLSVIVLTNSEEISGFDRLDRAIARLVLDE